MNISANHRATNRLLALLSTVLTAALALSISPHVAEAGPAKQKPKFMRVYGQSLPPYGFVQFCQMNRASCTSNARQRAIPRLMSSPDLMQVLDRINRKVNALVEPATDKEVYGVEEYWTFPGRRGDCEDYVVLKRHMLMKLGIPASALLITVVQDELGDGHAILVARTNDGDFVLDNKVNDIKLWTATPYKYIMRQSYLNPRVWVSLDPRATATPESLAGLR